MAGADVVVTAASFGPVRQVMTGDWLAPDALVVPVDYATYCAAEVARDAALFLVDQRDQFLANREAGLFEDYPDPAATIGEALIAGTPRPGRGRVVVDAPRGRASPTWSSDRRSSGAPRSSDWACCSPAETFAQCRQQACRRPATLRAIGPTGRRR